MIFTIKNFLILTFLSGLFYNNIKNYLITVNDYFTYPQINILFKKNIFLINGEINKKSINNTITLLKKITKIDNIEIMLDPTVHIIINSNGGDFLYGFKLILQMKSLKKQKIKFNCYAIKACSTAFTIFQYCDNRFVTPSSILYQHNATINFKGSFEEFRDFYETKFDKYSEIYSETTKYIANKIGLSYKNYIKKINKDWKMEGGKNIVKNKLADEVVLLHNLDFLINKI